MFDLAVILATSKTGKNNVHTYKNEYNFEICDPRLRLGRGTFLFLKFWGDAKWEY